jgi:hypothetical protein
MICSHASIGEKRSSPATPGLDLLLRARNASVALTHGAMCMMLLGR